MSARLVLSFIFMMLIFMCFIRDILSVGLQKSYDFSVNVPKFLHKPTKSATSSEKVYYPNRPHIIILMADDMGFNDVSFRGSSTIPTPNIDALGYQGLILNRHYVPVACTPSRASLLTGKYPVNTGMQHLVILPCKPYGLPLKFKLLPQYLKKAGYKTHLVGKWHLGHFAKPYVPTARGFDTFLGFYTGREHYFTHKTEVGDPNNTLAYDFRRNDKIAYDAIKMYNTHLFTNESLKIIQKHDSNNPLFLLVNYNAPHDPLEAPQQEIDKFSYIRNTTLRTYAAMISIMDKGIGQIIKELGKKNMLENSVILFYSDNGGQPRGPNNNQASNYPLRGQKYSPWEGATRVPAAIWHPALKVRHIVSNQLIHNSDWLPTFLRLARVKPNEGFDGFNIWPALNLQIPTPRKEIIHDIDPIDGFSSYYRKGWKYVNGSTFNGNFDSWLGSRARYSNPDAPKYAEIVRASDTWDALTPFALKRLTSGSIKKIRKSLRVLCQGKIPYGSKCKPVKAPCLFRIVDDPCEQNNLAKVYPHQLQNMAKYVEQYKAASAKVIWPPDDFEGCAPRKFNETVSPWVDLPNNVFKNFNTYKKTTNKLQFLK